MVQIFRKNSQNIQNNNTNDLSFEDFKNTNWIVSEEG